MTDEYRFEMYERGKTILVTEVMSLEQARDFFVKNYSKNVALRLFVNDEKIPYHLTARTLQMNVGLQCEVFSR